MAVDVETVLAGVDLVGVVEQRMDLAKRGHEFYGLCPFHGESTPSFTINPAGQFYHCFGCGAHGDAIDFLRELDGLTFKEAVAQLTDTRVTDAPRVQYPVPAEWQHIQPPADAPPLKSWSLPALGEPVAKYEINAADGSIIGWICRYADPEKPGGKQIRAFTYGSAGDGAPHWACRQFSRPRPLYGLDHLAARPNAQVILLEGEGKCDAAAALLPGLVAMSWIGGAGGVRHGDYVPLTKRNVLLLPDNDEPGREAVKWLREHLTGRGCVVKIIEPEADKPKGWNLDDALRDHWTPEQTRDWCKERLAGTLIPPSKPKPEPKPWEGGAQQVAKAQIEAAKMSDIDLADKFSQRAGDNWRYVAQWGTWYKWDGDGWQEDRTAEIKFCVSEMLRDVPNWEDAAGMTPIAKRAICSHRTVGAVVSLAGADRRIAATANQWDRNPWLLGVPGGVIDLKEGKLVGGASQEDYITRRCAVAPAPGVPRMWLEHLNLVQRGNQEMIGFLRRFCGYALLGKVQEHALLFFYGTGRNGKGVMLNTLVKLVGDYGYSAPVELMMESKTERHAVELAMLRGKRIVICSEPPKGAKWNDGRIRALTSADQVTARMLNQNPETFDPSHKLFIMGNHKPVLRSVDEAIKSRFNMIDFGFTIPEADRIGDFEEQLVAEWPQILQWMIDGCLEWQRVGLGKPSSVRAATEAYLDDEDTLGTFLADRCEFKGSDPVGTLFRAYQAWSEQVGERAGTSRAFVNALYERPNITRGRSATSRMVVGVQLRAEWRTNQ